MSYNSKYKGKEVEGILDSVGGKQDAITDLETIRSGAAAGATAVQPGNLAKVATSGSYNDLDDKPNADVYIADFTMVDIEMAIENATENVGNNFSVDADGTKLWEAIQRHKQIIIPYSNYADIGGYYIAASAYHNGVGDINLSIFAGNYSLNLHINKDYLLTNNKLNFNADGSVEQSIDWRFSYMTNEEATISDESRPETLVKRDSNGGIEVTNIDANFFRDTRGNTWTTPTASSEILTDADYVFQEQLKSGQNIKTVNNQSLLGSGNINIEGGSAVYITPFSADDLFTGIDFALANPDSFYLLDASPDLIYALREGKIILIPYRQDPGYLSAIRAKNDGETTYLTIPRGTTLIKLDIDDEDLYHDVIYLTANKISIEKISVSSEPYTIVKRSYSGGVNATAWHDDTGTIWVTPTSSQDTKEDADYILQEYISDLDAIRSGAEKGATALQSYTEQYKGTITGVTIEASNGLSGGGTVSADTGSTDGTIKIRGVAATNKGKLGMSVLYSGDLKDKTYQDGAAAAAAHTHSQYLTGVTINGTTKNPSSGVVDLGTVITAHQTLKTINGESIVGSGNITISGGGSGSSSGSGAYPEVDGSIYKQEDYSDNYYSTDLTPNTFYVFPECGTLDVFLGPQMAGIANEYIFQFTSGSEPTSLILPSDIKWANDEAPVIEANKIYQISILKGLGSVMSWDNSNLISFSVLWGVSSVLNFECEKGMTWEAFVASSYNTDSALKISNGNIWYSSYRIEDATPTSIIENGKMYTSIYND